MSVINGIRIEVNQADLDYVNAKLTEAGVKVPRAIANVLNRVGRDVRRKLITGARKTYTYKYGFRTSDITMKTASLAQLNVLLESEKKTHTLRRWKHTTPESGVKASVVKGGVKPLVNEVGAKAFIMPLNGGLIAQRKKKSRKPLRVLRGPSVPKMFEMVYKGKRNAPMQPETEKKLHDELYAEVQKHI